MKLYWGWAFGWDKQTVDLKKGQAVALVNSAGTPVARLVPAFRAGRGPTQLAHDGVHPSEYGQAMLGALIAVDVQKILDQGR